ncbi:MAG: methionyl-tRNA formyltransferase [Gammaproteobacteria bacterium]|nr:methionyl-tRNA formyltransferase [Gammaproteobacteria bacterium]
MRIIFAGTPEFAATALQALLGSRHQVVAVYTQPDRPAGRGRKLTPSAVKRVAEAALIPVLQPQTLKDSQVQQQLAAFQADVMVVAAYGLILPAAVLLMPRYGCLNIHASLLPRWRGAAPIQRAILAGDAESGITIMQMDVGLDTGAMIRLSATPITAGESAAQLHDRLAQIGAEEIVAVLNELAVTHGLTATAQDEAAACYAQKLVKQEATIHWQQQSSYLARQVAAFNPWPVAQTGLGEKVVRVWQAEAVAHAITPSLPPGTVIFADRHAIHVACGEGVLALKQLQLPGGKPLSAGEFLNAHSLDGAQFVTP